MSATVTSRGRITLPQSVPTAMKLCPGDRVVFVEIAPGRYEILSPKAPNPSA